MAIVGRGEKPARALPAGAASAASFPATCLRHWFPDKSPRGRRAGSLTPDQEHLHVPPRRPGAAAQFAVAVAAPLRSEEHTSELQSLMRISYAVFCLKKKNEYRTYISNPM